MASARDVDANIHSMDYGGSGEPYNPKIIMLYGHYHNTLSKLSGAEAQLY